MKKIMLSVALLAAVVMTSCGKTACDCKNDKIKLGLELLSSIGDADKIKDVEGKIADLDKSCKDFKPISNKRSQVGLNHWMQDAWPNFE